VDGPPPRLNAQLVATGSLVIDCLLVLAKLTTGLLTGSLALVSEAAHSGLDLVASAFALVAIRASHKPADTEHPYGHGRAENLAAFGEGVILLITAVVIGYEGTRRLLGEPVHVDPALYAILFVAGTMALEMVRFAILRWAARNGTARRWRAVPRTGWRTSSPRPASWPAWSASGSATPGPTLPPPWWWRW